MEEKEETLYNSRLLYISQMEILSSCWEIYIHILPHYKYLIKDLKGFHLYIWDDKRENYPNDLPIYPRINPKRDVNKLKKVIISVIDFFENKVTREINIKTPFLLGRNIIGTNLFLPRSIENDSFTIDSGRIYGHLAGVGLREFWEKKSGVWGVSEFKSTWRS